MTDHGTPSEDRDDTASETFLERWQRDGRGYNDDLEPLRERFPIYLRIFSLLVGGLVVLGLGIAALGGGSARAAIGYTFIFGGTLLMLVGGARGGGYTNLGVGAVEALVSGRNRADDDYVEDEDLRRGKVLKRRDPMDRLRRGLRPPANPTAFWQTVAGLVLVVVGVPLTF